MSKNSEFRAYPFILKSLEDLDWDSRNPVNHPGGQVFTQNEALHDKILKPLLENRRPENIVKVTDDIFWTVEAKAEHRDLNTAVDEAKQYAAAINKSNKVKGLFATGVAGVEDSTFLVETHFFDGKKWDRVKINSIETTGFIDRNQALQIINTRDSNLKDQEISGDLFLQKANSINKILHDGAINKRNRASVMASLLLALVEDDYMLISADPTTLIEDINSRVRAILDKYGKKNFAQEIEISLPTSRDNHRKNRKALVDSLQELRSINIKSAINSGVDLLGQFYEIFLKYANDAKEIGIVLTPRHITRFGAEALNITDKDYILDPTCGTGGFLVAALDRVKKYSPKSFDGFKQSHIFGVEQDAEVVALALVNMIFRGDGNSNIYEGNAFDNYFFQVESTIKKIKYSEYQKLQNKNQNPKRIITRTLMNPPFAVQEKEYRFVNHALDQMVQGGLLFAILPTSTMSSTGNLRGEITWRQNLLLRHTLKAVIKLSDDLFMPNAHKGTYGVIIEAWKPHGDSKIFWAIMDDGFTMKKAKRLSSENVPSNMKLILKELKSFLSLNKSPKNVEKVITLKKLAVNDPTFDCGPEAYLNSNLTKNIDLSSTTSQLFNALLYTRTPGKSDLKQGSYKLFNMDEIFEHISRGDCPPLNGLKAGSTPVVTTTEESNGIGGYFEIPVGVTNFKDSITIPANGSKYRAFYHPYGFSSVPDILVCKLKPAYASLEAKLFICSVINQSSWRFSYFRKCNEKKLWKDVHIPLPIEAGQLDIQFITRVLQETPTYNSLKKIMDGDG